MVLKPEVLIYNLTSQRIPSKNFFCDTIKKALGVLKERKKIILSLIFIDSQNIRRLNNYWRSKNKPTSVLSFSFRKTLLTKSGKKAEILGDIFLCPEEIKKQVGKFDVSLRFFYQKLIVHSLLHLYGDTHSREKNRQKMENLEDKILRKINKQ